MKRIVIVAVPHPEHEDLFLFFQRRDSGKFTTPGGHVEEGEDVEASAYRELEEEAGISPDQVASMDLLRNQVAKGFKGESLDLYLYQATLKGIPQINLRDDVDQEGVPGSATWLNPMVTDKPLHVPRERNILIQQMEEKPGKLGKSELEKGAKQRLFPVTAPKPAQRGSSKYDFMPPGRESEQQWQVGKRGARDQLVQQSPDERARGLLSLGKRTKSRLNASGEREYLLHRGHGPKEIFGESHKESPSSWSPIFEIAKERADNERENGKVTSAWFPESDLKHLIFQTPGQFTEESHTNPKTKIKGRKLYPEFAWEREVIVRPGHAGKLATPEDLSPDLDSRIDSRLKSRTKAKEYEHDSVRTNREIYQKHPPRKLAAAELEKAPQINEDEDTPNWMPNSPGHFGIKSHELQTFDIGGGLFHHVHRASSAGYSPQTYHFISRGDPNDPIGHMIVANKRSGPQVAESVLDDTERGKGLGTKMYEAALRHHGTLESDDTVSPAANKVWGRLKKLPTAEVQLDSYPGDSTHRAKYVGQPAKAIKPAPKKKRQNPNQLELFPKSKRLASSELQKGSRQRKLPWSPTAIPKDEKSKIAEWQEGAHRDLRDDLEPMAPNAIARAVHRISRQTKVTTIDGQPHILLHRGMGSNEHDNWMRDQITSSTSWTPRKDLANNFGNTRAASVSAWVPVSAITHVPRMAGAVDENKPGPNLFGGEHEVIVAPHSLILASDHEASEALRPAQDLLASKPVGRIRQEQNERRIMRQQGQKLASSETDLAKGSAQRRMPVNPAAIPKEERGTVQRWLDNANRMTRDRLPPMTPHMRVRGLSRLAGKTQTAIIDGERHYLLHRGVGEKEYGQRTSPDASKIDHPHDSFSSWTSDPARAESFGHDYALDDIASGNRNDPEDKEPLVVSAWIPESKIHNIPYMYGEQKKKLGPTGLSVPGSEYITKSPWKAEEEIVVAPHAPRYHDHKFSENVNDLVNARGAGKETPKSMRRRVLGKSELEKAPLEYTDYKDGPISRAAGHQKLTAEYDLKGGLKHKIFGVRGAKTEIHELHHPNFGHVGTLTTIRSKDPKTKKTTHSVMLSEVLPQHRGKGLGTALYESALNHYGTLLSDESVSQDAAGVWGKLARSGKYKVDLPDYGWTTEPFRAEVRKSEVPPTIMLIAPEDQMAMAQREHVADDQIAKVLVQSPIEHVRAELAGNHQLSDLMQCVLARDPSSVVRRRLASNWLLPEPAAVHLWGDLSLREAIRKNPHAAHPKVLDLAAGSHNPEDQSWAAMHPSSPYEAVRKLSLSESPRVATAALLNPGAHGKWTTPDLSAALMNLTDHQDLALSYAVAANTALEDKAFRQDLLKHPNPFIRAGVAGSPAASRDERDELLKDPHWSISLLMASHGEPSQLSSAVETLVDSVAEIPGNELEAFTRQTGHLLQPSDLNTLRPHVSAEAIALSPNADGHLLISLWEDVEPMVGQDPTADDLVPSLILLHDNCPPDVLRSAWETRNPAIATILAHHDDLPSDVAGQVAEWNTRLQKEMPQVKFPGLLPKETRPDSQVQIVNTPRQKDIFARKVGEAARRFSISRGSTKQVAGIDRRNAHSVGRQWVESPQFTGGHIHVTHPTSTVEAGTFASPGQFKNPQVAAKDLGTTVAHEGLHRLLTHVGNKFSEDHKQAVINHLYDHVDPELDRFVEGALERSYNPKTPGYNEEKLIGLRDLVSGNYRKGAAEQYYAANSGKHESSFRDLTTRAKKAWYQAYQKAKALRPDHLHDILARSKREKS